MKLFRGFAVASAVLAFAVAVLGSWVRINGAGLTCPDWPLCHGALVPDLHGGVVLEWSHRLAALLAGVVSVGAIITGLRERKRIAGVTGTLAALAIIFALQVSLGGITVFLANSPVSVMLHWAMGMALLATLTVLATLALLAPTLGSVSRSAAADGPAPVLAAAAVLGFCAMCAGAYVSSSFAGLACTTVPVCDGSVFGRDAAQIAQMTHRLLAAAFVLVALLAAWASTRSAPRVRAFAYAGILLVVVQATLGIANVVLRLPIALREAHAANAGAAFLAFVIAAVLATLDAAREPANAHLPARGARRAVTSA